MGSRVSNVSFWELTQFGSFKSTFQLQHQPTSKFITPVKQTQPEPQSTVNTTVHPVISQDTPDKNVLKENLAYINAGLALVSLGIAGYAIARGRNSKNTASDAASKLGDIATRIENMTGQVSGINGRIDTLANEVSSVGSKNSALEGAISTVNNTVSGINSTVTELGKSVESVSRRADANSELLKEGGWFDNFIKDVDKRVKELQAIREYNTSPHLERNVGYIDGMPLLRNVNNDGNPIRVDESLKDWLKTVAGRYINRGEDHIEINKLNRDSSVWSLTFESKPEKEGGLGEVPVQIAKNLRDTFQIDNPLVRPLSLIPGKSQLINENGKYIYKYNLKDPKPWSMEVDKVAEFETQVSRNGKVETQPVQVFVGIDPEYKFKRIMFANNDYFTAGGLYQNSQKATEVERCAFFTKVVYEFAKYLKDPASMPNMNISNSAELKKLKAPSAMILNDWHAAAMAALLRFKAPFEAKFGELSKKAAEELTNMNLVNINHNLDYQGINHSHREDVINTLFDKYAYDIYENAKTGFGFDGLKNVLMTGDNVNLANMGASLSNILKPVSPTYAKEVGEQSRRSHSMQHILDVRRKQGTLVGASNGWDRDFNDVSVSKIQKFNDSINSDKFEIFKHSILNIKGLDSEKHRIISSLFEQNLNSRDFKVLIEELRKLDSAAINDVLDKMQKEGITELRQFNPYTYADSPEEIMLARKRNKQMFIEFLNSMNEYNKKVNKIFNIVSSENTDLSHLTPEDIENTVVFNMGVRFVSQKGVDVACQSIKRVLTEWETKFPGRRKPIFVIGGADAEGGAIKKIAYNLKAELGPDLGKYLVYQDGYTKNNIFQAGSDFTLYSSHFEPDGAKWESLYKGTPVICTRVGGHVDSVTPGYNGFLTKRTIPEIDSVSTDEYGNRIYDRYLKELSDDFTESIYDAVNTYYNKDAYTQMVMNSILGDQSWLIKDGSGKITGGALLGHMKDLGFDLKEFPEIKIADA